jgi:hypothetical protein
MSTKNKNLVLFHKVKIKSVILINGKQFVKFSPRKVMSAEGQIISIPDAEYVRTA